MIDLARVRADTPGIEIEKALALLDQITRDTRDLTYELCPPVLYQMGLILALQRLAEQFTQRYGIARTANGRTLGPEDLNLRGLAYQTIRELLNNTAKHAHAKNVDIMVAEIDGNVRVTLTDDGIGFDSTNLQLGNRHGKRKPSGTGTAWINE